MFDKLVTKVKIIDTTRIVLKTQCNTDELDPEKKNDADRRIYDTKGPF